LDAARRGGGNDTGTGIGEGDNNRAGESGGEGGGFIDAAAYATSVNSSSSSGFHVSR
jgi:hypothetical protein